MSEPNTQDREKVLDRIRKLMALAGDNPNEHEASAAAEKAQVLLAQYNLSASDLVQKKGPELIFDDEFEFESRPWPRPVITSVAKMYFCECYFTFQYDVVPTRKEGGYVRTDRWTFVGELQNVTVAKLFIKYLLQTIDRLAKDGASKLHPGKRSAFVTSFKAGCSNRLAQRMTVRRMEAMNGKLKVEAGLVEGNRNLPALKSMYEVMEQKAKDAIKDKVGGTKPHKKKGVISDQGGYAAGREAGDKIGLDQQIGGKDPTRPGHLLPKPGSNG